MDPFNVTVARPSFTPTPSPARSWISTAQTTAAIADAMQTTTGAAGREWALNGQIGTLRGQAGRAAIAAQQASWLSSVTTNVGRVGNVLDYGSNIAEHGLVGGSARSFVGGVASQSAAAAAGHLLVGANPALRIVGMGVGAMGGSAAMDQFLDQVGEGYEAGESFYRTQTDQGVSANDAVRTAFGNQVTWLSPDMSLMERGGAFVSDFAHAFGSDMACLYGIASDGVEGWLSDLNAPTIVDNVPDGLLDWDGQFDGFAIGGADAFWRDDFSIDTLFPRGESQFGDFLSDDLGQFGDFLSDDLGQFGDFGSNEGFTDLFDNSSSQWTTF